MPVKSPPIEKLDDISTESVALFKKLRLDKKWNEDAWREWSDKVDFCENAARQLLTPKVFTSFYKAEREAWAIFDKVRQHSSLPTCRAEFRAYRDKLNALFLKAWYQDNGGT